MRGLGAARTSALFGTAPFAGIALSFLLFHEAISAMFLIAIPLMIVGTIFLVYEEHEHRHVHDAILHEHSHLHSDGHHDHEHGEGEVYSLSHSHIHNHPHREHEHHHMPDIHHRHAHPLEN
jgi:ABC-type nickel/cobalt efflux system permease component RcnA